MNDEKIKGKIEKFVDEPGVAFEKVVKDFGKIKEIIDNPGIAIEKGVKKGWEYAIYTGKEVKSNVTKKSKRIGKKSKRK